MKIDQIENEHYHRLKAIECLHMVARHYELANLQIPTLEIDMIIAKREKDLENFTELNYPLVTKGK